MSCRGFSSGRFSVYSGSGSRSIRERQWRVEIRSMGGVDTPKRSCVHGASTSRVCGRNRQIGVQTGLGDERRERVTDLWLRAPPFSAPPQKSPAPIGAGRGAAAATPIPASYIYQLLFPCERTNRALSNSAPLPSENPVLISPQSFVAPSGDLRAQSTRSITIPGVRGLLAGSASVGFPASTRTPRALPFLASG